MELCLQCCFLQACAFIFAVAVDHPVLYVKKEVGVSVFELWNASDLYCGEYDHTDLFRHDYIDHMDYSCIEKVSVYFEKQSEQMLEYRNIQTNLLQKILRRPPTSAVPKTVLTGEKFIVSTFDNYEFVWLNAASNKIYAGIYFNPADPHSPKFVYKDTGSPYTAMTDPYSFSGIKKANEIRVILTLNDSCSFDHHPNSTNEQVCPDFQPPTLTSSPTSEAELILSTALLNCDFGSSNAPVTSLWWTFTNTTTGSSITIVPSQVSGKYSGGNVTIPSLTINLVMESDIGTYNCNGGTKYTSKTGRGPDVAFTLIEAPPLITNLRSMYQLFIGADAVLPCAYNSYPTPTSVEWEKNGASLQKCLDFNRYSGGSVNDPSLSISNVDICDAGIYRCCVTNAKGRACGNDILVGAKPLIVTSQNPIIAIYGKPLVIGCSIVSDPALEAVRWHISTEYINIYFPNPSSVEYNGSTTNSPSLGIYQTQFYDKGEYTCQARNRFGQSVSNAVQVFVYGVEVRTSMINHTLYGDSVYMNCTVDGLPDVSGMFWTKDNGTYTTLVGRNETFRGSTTSLLTLTIDDVNFDDMADYRCHGYNDYDARSSQPVHLEVFGVVPNVYDDEYVTKGDSVELHCTIQAVPSVTKVVWKKANGSDTFLVNITNTVRYGGSSPSQPSLIIHNTTFTDAGIYICQAENDYQQQTSKGVKLTVYGVEANVSNVNYTIYGQDVTLNCSVYAVPNVVDVYWTVKYGTNTSYISTNDTYKYGGSTTSLPSLTIYNLTFADQAVYYCHAFNHYQHSRSSAISLTVFGVSVTAYPISYEVVYDDSLEIRCEIEAVPSLISVFWKMDNGSHIWDVDMANTNKYGGSSPSQSSLLIYNASFADAVKYYCEGKNNYQTQVSDAVTVFGVYPIVIPDRYTVVYGDNVKLNCRIVNVPNITNVQWKMKIGGMLVDVDMTRSDKYAGSKLTSPSLIIYNVTFDDDTEYHCEAENDYNKRMSSAVNVTVTGGKPRVEINQNFINVCQADTTTLICRVDSLPFVHKIVWWKQVNGSLQSVPSAVVTKEKITTHSLKFTNIQLTDAGIYYCSAKNFLGETYSNEVNMSVYHSDSVCPCSCYFKERLEYWASQNTTNYTLNELRVLLGPMLKEMEEELKVDKSNISAFVYKKISASDNRKSSQSVGIVGIALLVTILASIVFVDLSSLVSFIKQSRMKTPQR